MWTHEAFLLTFWCVVVMELVGCKMSRNACMCACSDGVRLQQSFSAEKFAENSEKNSKKKLEVRFWTLLCKIFRNRSSECRVLLEEVEETAVLAFVLQAFMLYSIYDWLSTPDRITTSYNDKFCFLIVHFHCALCHGFPVSKLCTFVH